MTATASVSTQTLRGQVAVVTGGAGGLGLAISRELGMAGAIVIVADIAAEPAARSAEQLAADGIDAHPHVLDVTSRQSIDAMAAEVNARHGRIDILVNNAGFPVDRPLVSMSDEDWHQVLNVCLYGTFACSRAVVPGMIERGYGRILNISSRAYLGNPGQANYSAAKAGIVGLTRTLAKELGKHNITVNAIAPGLIATETVRRHPKFDAIAERAERANSIRRLGTPEDISAAALYLASPAASFVTGDVLHVTGGRFS